MDSRDPAQLLRDARQRRALVARPSSTRADFDLEQAYRVADRIHRSLCADGWRGVGRKLGFTNRATWSEFELATPIWSYVYDETVIDCGAEIPDISLHELAQPRLEPEIVLGLNDGIRTAGNDLTAIGAAVEWTAPGFEIVDCHYADWQFNAADILADFGAHAMLVVGRKTPVDDHRDLAEKLAGVMVDLVCDDALVDSGTGSNALGGPLSALRYLVDALHGSEAAAPLEGGEIVTTGTLTGIPYIKPGEHWRAEFRGAGVHPLTIALSA